VSALRETAERIAATVQRGAAIEIANAFHHVILDAPEEVAVAAASAAR
jgi:hypothetical protein